MLAPPAAPRTAVMRTVIVRVPLFTVLVPLARMAMVPPVCPAVMVRVCPPLGVMVAVPAPRLMEAV